MTISNPRSILIIKPSSLGDVVHALPVLHALRRRFPDARIDWLIGSAFAPLLAGQPALDDALEFDRKAFGRMWFNPRSAIAFVRFLRELRQRRYDVVLDLQGLFRSGFLARVTGAPARIGFDHARELAWLFYNRRVRIPQRNQHAVDINMQMLNELGLPDEPIEFGLTIPDQAGRDSARALADAGIGNDDPLVGIAPGARWETKRWPADRFAGLIDRLHDLGARCVVLGGPDEVELARTVVQSCRAAPADLCGSTSLPVLTALIGRCNVIVCHDSAPMHMAVALGTPLVCITGPTNPVRTGPYRRLEDVVRLSLDCSPCYLRRRSQCPHSHQCMNDLDVDTVFSAVQSRLELQPVVPV